MGKKGTNVTSLQGYQVIPYLPEYKLLVDKTVNHQDVLSTASQMMREKFGIYECTVQLEDYVDDMMNCTQCQDPAD